MKATPLLKGWAGKGKRASLFEDGGGYDDYYIVEQSWRRWQVRDRESRNHKVGAKSQQKSSDYLWVWNFVEQASF